MKIDIFEPTSFCFGVKLSLKIIEDTVNSYKDKNIFCIGQPVHNEIITNKLEKMGLNIIYADPNEYADKIRNLPNNSVVIFSAHGHDKKLNEICVNKNMIIIDAICPIVKSIHEQIDSYSKQNQQIIFIGKKNHPETVGILNISNLVNFWEFSSSFSVDFCIKSPVVFNQTTIMKNNLLPIYDEILSKDDTSIIKNTSCNHVQKRFDILHSIDKNAYDYILIIGSNTSSNTKELYKEATKLFGKEKALLISKAEDVNSLINEDIKSIAILSSTSAPIELINEVKTILTK